jgi:hypothetical protein
MNEAPRSGNESLPLSMARRLEVGCTASSPHAGADQLDQLRTVPDRRTSILPTRSLANSAAGRRKNDLGSLLTRGRNLLDVTFLTIDTCRAREALMRLGA